MKYTASNGGINSKKIDYNKRVIFSFSDFPEKGHLLQTVTVPPKTKQRLHVHHKQTEVVYVLQGEATMLFNDKVFIAKPGDAFIDTPNDTHCIWNKAETDFIVLIFKINMPEDTDDTTWLA